MEKTEKELSLSSFLTFDGWRIFFLGRAYPFLIATFVLFGNITSLDYYVNFIITGLFVFAMIISDTVRPFFITACSYIYQISIPHAPGYPTYSDFFFSGWRRFASVILIAFVVLAFVIFVVRNKIYRQAASKRSRLILSVFVFSLALIVNGIFSDSWTYKGLIFGFLNTLVYFFLFFIVAFGFNEREKMKDLIDYFCYISLLISAVIILELLHLFITADGIFRDGAIVKDKVALGWGIWNIIGNSLASLIPVLFYRAMRGKGWLLYFSFATLSCIFAVLSMSRNAFLFSTIAYFLCMVISCFYAENKKFFRIFFLMGVILVSLFGIMFFEEIRLIFSDYFSRGFSDSGRFALWRLAIETFLKSPLFGSGFYGFFTDAVFEYSSFPRMAHNTVFQLLSSMGIFGLISYAWYRIETLKVIIKRPSLPKTMLGISMLVFLLGSLLDNFVFNLHPPIYYTIALALCCREDRKN